MRTCAMGASGVLSAGPATVRALARHLSGSQEPVRVSAYLSGSPYCAARREDTHRALR